MFENRRRWTKVVDPWTISGRMNRRRNLSKIDPQLQRLQVARRLAERLGAMPQEIRYVELWFHDGRQWTRNSYWEHWVDGRWQEVPWTVHNG